MSTPVAKQCNEMRALLAIQSKIKRLNLAQLVDNKVTIRKLPKSFATLGKGCWITPLPEGVEPADNQTDLVSYNSQVTLILPGNQMVEDLATLNLFLSWRQQCRNAFLPTDGPTLEGCEDFVETVRYVPGYIYNPEAFEANIDAQAFVLQVLTREDRQSL